MRRTTLLFTLSLSVTSLSGQGSDPRIIRLTDDLKTIHRVLEVTREADEVRKPLLAIVDDQIAELREKRADGSFRWAYLEREEGARTSEEDGVEKVFTEPGLQKIAVSAPGAYRFAVTVPMKRNLVSANQPIFVRSAAVEITGFDGRTTRSEQKIEVWIKPGESRSFPLSEIAKSARVVIEAGVESGEKKGVARLSLLQARLVNDPKGPFFDSLQRLDAIRGRMAADKIRKDELRTLVDEALVKLPGEMERRMARTGAGPSTITTTPEVLVELERISALMTGDLQRQAEGRERLAALLRQLRSNP